MTFADRFVAVPDLFPARSSGEPWGERALHVDVAGLPIVVRGLDEAFAQRTRDRFGPAAEEAPPTGAVAADVRVFRAAEGDFRKVDLAGKDYAFELAYGPDDVRIAGPRWMARVDQANGTPRAALWTPNLPPDSFLGALENLLRVLAAYRLVRLGGALFHSAAIVDEGRAHLFLGHSGAGKSTLSRKSVGEGRTVLSDELNGLARLDGRLFVQQLPFAGDFGQCAPPGEPVPLEAVYRLEKGSRPGLSPLPASEATALLLACSPFVNADQYRLDALLGNIEQLARDVPFRRFVCSLSEPAWTVLRGEEVTLDR